MGTFTEEITLDNVGDIINVRNGRISDANIRTVTLDALPDTGAWTPAINEEVRQKLGLAVVELVNQHLAGVHGDQQIHRLK